MVDNTLRPLFSPPRFEFRRDTSRRWEEIKTMRNMMKLLVAGVALAGVVLSAGCKSDCEKAFDNTVKIMEGEKDIPEEGKKMMKTDAFKKGALEECKKEKPENVKCALNAKSYADLNKCKSKDEPKAPEAAGEAAEEAGKAAEEAGKAAQEAGAAAGASAEEAVKAAEAATKAGAEAAAEATKAAEEAVKAAAEANKAAVPAPEAPPAAPEAPPAAPEAPPAAPEAPAADPAAAPAAPAAAPK